MVVESQDTFRNKDAWLKFLPNVAKIKDPNEKTSAEEEAKV